MSPSAPPSPTSSTSSLSTPLDPVASMMGAGDDDASSPGLHDTLAPPRELKAKGVTPITFDGQLTRTLRYHEDVRNGCGGQTWPAGMVLGKHLLRYHREELKDARILEVGAGGGLVGLGVALECNGVQSRLLLTDQVEMLDLMRHNIELNEVQHRAEALILNWGEPLPQKVVETKPNVIIAAECVYFEPAFPLLMTTLQDLLALNPDAIVYFCFKKRRRADMRFVKMARKAFAVDDLHDDDRPVFQRQGLFLFRFRSKTAARAAAKASASSTAAKDKVMVHTDIAATDETVHTASAAMDKMTVNAATDKTVHSAAVSTTGSTTDAASTASSTCSSEGGNTTELP